MLKLKICHLKANYMIQKASNKSGLFGVKADLCSHISIRVLELDMSLCA